jgi:sphingolipid delta-4 desaturase
MGTNPHEGRARQILAQYPQVQQLVGNDYNQVHLCLVIFVTHFLIAFQCTNVLLCAILACSLGAFLTLGCLAAIHETSHYTIFRSFFMNKVVGIVMNLPILFPLASVFHQHHRLHHNHLSDDILDVDMPTEFEIKFVGNNAFFKFVWLSLNGIILSLRSLYKLGIERTTYYYVNNLTSFAFIGLLFWFYPFVLLYFAFSLALGLGFHPANSRILQRHGKPEGAKVSVAPTYSYYGWHNYFTFNFGYHLEHHDFPRIPGSRLPILKKMVPEYYSTQPVHASRSWSQLWDFVWNKDTTLHTLYEN